MQAARDGNAFEHPRVNISLHNFVHQQSKYGSRDRRKETSRAPASSVHQLTKAENKHKRLQEAVEFLRGKAEQTILLLTSLASRVYLFGRQIFPSAVDDVLQALGIPGNDGVGQNTACSLVPRQ